MFIKSIHIDSFGTLIDKDFDFSQGLNIIRGENESGKSTLAMFIKFMFYGLSAKIADGTLTERQKYLSWYTGTAAGSMTVCAKDGEYRIERELFCHGDGNSVRERVRVTDTLTGEKVFKNEIPGVALLGMPEQIFVNTAFIRQLGGRVDGDGLAASIENLIMTGDESLSTKKAMEKLEKCRVSLRHKTGGGGKINELLREVARLKEELSAAEKSNSDTILLETSVGELENSVKEREKTAAECAELCDAYKKISELEKLKDARYYKSEIEETDKKIAEFAKYGKISDSVVAIRDLSSGIKHSEEIIRTLRRRKCEIDAILPPALDERDIEEAGIEIETAEKCLKTKGKRIGFGILSMIASGAAVALDLLFVKAPNHIYVLGAAAVFLLLGFFLLFTGISKSRKYKSILRRHEARDLRDLKIKISDMLRLAAERVDPESEFGIVLDSIKSEEDKKFNDTEKLRRICRQFTPEVSDTDVFAQNALLEAEKLSAVLEGLREKRIELFGKYSVLSDIFGKDDGAAIEKAGNEALKTEAGKTASRMTEEEAENAKRKKNFAEGTLPQLRAQLEEKRTRLGILRATTASPSVIAVSLSETMSELDTLSERFEAITLATEALEKAGENIRRSIIPRISDEAGRLAANYTHGKYTELMIGRNFGISIDSGGKTREVDFLSEGTKDIAYICLRSALLHVLFEKDIPPAIYDESFAGIDERRLQRILIMLSTAGNENQSLVFTCRRLEGEIAQSIDTGNIIDL